MLLIILLSRIAAESARDLPMSDLNTSCVLYDGELFDGFKGPRPSQMINLTRLALFNSVKVEMDGEYHMQRNETVQIMNQISTTILLGLSITTIVGIANILVTLCLLKFENTSPSTGKSFIRVQQTDL